MLVFMLGKPKSGKSIFVENMLSTFGSVLYVGTIPYTLDTRPSIEAHRARRPSHWLLYECIGDLEQDLTRVTGYIDHTDAILIDGLSYYVIEGISFNANYNLASVKALLSFFRHLRRSHTLGIVIDHYNVMAEPLEYSHTFLLHKMLKKYANRFCHLGEGKCPDFTRS